MKLLDTALRILTTPLFPTITRAARPAQPSQREFIAGKVNRLNQSFTAEVIKTNSDIQRYHNVLVARSRELAKNSTDYRKWLRMCERNIVGHQGFRLQSKVKMQRGGKLDAPANEFLEKFWKRFQASGQCTTRRRGSGRGLDKLIVRSLKVDGEVFLRRVPGFRNEARLAYQLLDPIACPVDLEAVRPGRRIRMGVELDEWDAPLAYWFRAGSAGDNRFEALNPTNPGERYIRIPADEILHLYYEEFPGQLRGFPFGQAAMQNIYTLGGYFYTELTAADAGARKMGFYKPPAGTQFGGREDTAEAVEGEDTTGTGAKQMEILEQAEPATFGVLPDGWDFMEYNPQHPAGNFAPFVQAQKRNIANGLDVAYNIFANDLVGVNFSSIRQGIVDERDAWMDDQQFLIEEWKTHQFEDWLGMLLLLPATPYDPADFDRLNAPRWSPHRWPWVDPSNDADAKLKMLTMGATTPQKIASEQGEDFDENVEQIQAALEAMAPLQQILQLMQSLQSALKPVQPAAAQLTKTPTPEDDNA
jgi:lambda family phage portal protein